MAYWLRESSQYLMRRFLTMDGVNFIFPVYIYVSSVLKAAGMMSLLDDSDE